MVLLAILLLTALLYLPSLHFGLLWDDPFWYGRVIDRPLRDLIRPMADFQFYRPGTMLYNRLFLQADNTFAPPLMHAAQIGWHLLNIALLYAFTRRLQLGRGVAGAAAALFALYPLSHQAVAWAAPQQPLAFALQTAAWLAYVAARRRPALSATQSLSLLLFLLALAVQESSVAMSIVPLLLETIVYRQGRRLPWRGGPFWRTLFYPAAAAAFSLLWLLAPRQAGITALSLEKEVLIYFIQGAVFPLLLRPSGYAPHDLLHAAWLILLFVASTGLLLALALRAGRGRQALFALLWALAGIAPGLIGLSYSYVQVSPRLFYYAAPGLALLWSCALWPPARSPLRSLRATAGLALLALVCLLSVRLLLDFQSLYHVGASHMAQLTEAITESPGDRYLFVNFPDRLAPRRRPLPFGYWGLTLAPIVMELDAFPALVTGRHLQTASYSQPWIDAHARETGPYLVDLRGEITPVETLYAQAAEADGVFLSRYRPQGHFNLLWVGSVVAGSPFEPQPCALAKWNETACLQAAVVEASAEGLVLRLTWSSLSVAGVHDTIFAHLNEAGRPPIAQDDGDAWLDTLPLWVWRPGDTIQERRIIRLPHPLPPGDYALRVGLYNRVTGQRLTGRDPNGQRLPDDSFTIGPLSDYLPPDPGSG